MEVENGILPYAAVVIDKTINYPLRPNSVEKVERKVMIEEDIKAPITKGDVVGTVEYYLDDHLIGKGNLISTIDILEVPPPKLYEFLLDKWYLVAFTLIISLRIIRLYNRTKRRRRRRSKIFDTRKPGYKTRFF